MQGLFFMELQRKKKSAREGNRPLPQPEAGGSLDGVREDGSSKQRGFRERVRHAPLRAAHRSDPIHWPIVPLVPELAAVFD